MALGQQLIRNGTFDTDLSQWLFVVPSGTVWDNGRALVADEPNDMYQPVALVAGHTYQLSFDYQLVDTNHPTNSFHYYLDTSIVTINNISDTSLHNYFIETTIGTPLEIDGSPVFTLGFVNVPNGSGTGIYIDNISVREVLPANQYLQTTLMVGSETGNVQTLNAGKDDSGTPINFELDTQELEFGERAHLKEISDKVVVFANNGIDSSLSVRKNDEDFKPIQMQIDKDVNIGQNINTKGNFFTFRWSGTSKETSPVLEGLQIETITDKGITHE